MKNLFILNLFLVFYLIPQPQVIAQHTFIKRFFGTEDQIINNVIEDDEGNFLMGGRILKNMDELYGAYLIKIDSTGNLINELNIHPVDTLIYMVFDLHYFADHYYLLGTCSETDMNGTSSIWFLKLNKDLEILDDKESLLPRGHWFSSFSSIIDSDTNFVIAGYVTQQDSTYGLHNDPGFYKLNFEGDSINSLFLFETGKSKYAYDLIEDTSKSKYFAFVSRFGNSSWGQRLTLTNQLDSIDIKHIPMGIRDYYSPLYLNDTSILICGLGSGLSKPYSLNIASLDLQNQLINYNHFEKNNDMRDHTAKFNGVSKNGDHIYVGGTSNLDYANPFWSNFNSWYHLVKINPDLSPVWENWYGGDAYYFLYSILATSDGGCIMVGNRYDDETQYQERDIYVVKVNAEGLLVWTQEIAVEGTKELVYPNPGTGRLNIESNKEDLDFEMINVNGQVLIHQRIESDRVTINTESIKPGVYFYQLIDRKSNQFESGKWIKQ